MRQKTAMRVVAWASAAIVAGVTAIAFAQQAPVDPLGPAAALSAIVDLRKQNAQLRAMMIGRDQALANCQYSAEKEQADLRRRLAETRADLTTAQLTKRAEELLPTLRELFEVDEAVPFDWRTGLFATPAAKSGETDASVGEKK